MIITIVIIAKLLLLLLLLILNSLFSSCFLIFVKQVHNCPSVYGTSSIEGFCLAVSSQLLVFDASCCSLQAKLSFGEGSGSFSCQIS